MSFEGVQRVFRSTSAVLRESIGAFYGFSGSFIEISRGPVSASGDFRSVLDMFQRFWWASVEHQGALKGLKWLQEHHGNSEGKMCVSETIQMFQWVFKGFS